MKVALKPGAELDLLNQDELRSVVKETLSGWRRPPVTVRPTEGGLLDGSGNLNGEANGIRFYEVPVGYTFRLHRLTVLCDGYTFGVPYSSATGYLNIVHGSTNQIEDGIAFSSPGLPTVFSAGTADGIVFLNGEVVRIDVYGGPASRSIVLRGQGTLQPTDTDQ